MFLKAEILNVDMNLSAPEKPVAAESEDEKNGHRGVFFTLMILSPISYSQNYLCFQVTQTRVRAWTC